MVERKAFLVIALATCRGGMGFIHPVSQQTNEVRPPSDTVGPSSWYPKVMFLTLSCLPDRVLGIFQTPRESFSVEPWAAPTSTSARLGLYTLGPDSQPVRA